MIQMICDEEGIPQEAGYSWHYEAKIRDWDDVDLFLSNYPKVYVERGGHASNFGTLDPASYTSGKMHGTDYGLIMLNSQARLKFRGRWGRTHGVL